MRLPTVPWFLHRAGLVLTSLILAAVAQANPIALPAGVEVRDDGNYTASKLWERCLVVVDKKGGTVSCAIGYALRPEKSGTHNIEFRLPVLVPEGTVEDREEGLKRCAPRLEVGQKMSTPSYVHVLTGERKAPYRAPKGMDVVLFGFFVDIGKELANATVTFSYRQPLHEEKFVYVPLFENGRDPPAGAEFTLTAFPGSPDLTLSLASRNKSVRAEMQTRVTVNLRQSDEIQIAVK